MTSKNHMTFKAPPFTRLSPICIVLAYALIGLLWIFLSDNLTGALFRDASSFQDISLLKGFLFILVTSALLYLLIRFFIKELQTSGNILQAAFQ